MPYIGYFQEIWRSMRKTSARLNLLKPEEGEDQDSSLETIVERLMGARGEASTMLLGRKFLVRYETSTAEEKLSFFNHLLTDFDLDTDELLSLVTTYHNDPKPGDYRAVLNAATSRRQQLFSKLHEAPGGISTLVKLRADLRKASKTNPALLPIDVDLRQLFLSWFNRGFLSLQPIDWQTPANILEKIIAYEAVHEISNWSQLRARLEPTDRRCYAFFHLAIPDEPLIFVEIALTTDIPSNIQTLLDVDRTPIESEQASVAVFYSISNCQPGLAGISFGNFLIKQVSRDLSEELPELSEFVTLSPMPGFKDWLTSKTETDGSDHKDIADLLAKLEASPPDEDLRNTDLDARLKQLAAQYLVEATNDRGLPLNSVARFHLGNGARIERLNPMGDTSENGMQQAMGMMVNYYYDLNRVAEYHESYALDREIASSKEIKSLLE